MTIDTRCSYCLEHYAACASLRLFSGRSCCPECTHQDHPRPMNATDPRGSAR